MKTRRVDLALVAIVCWWLAVVIVIAGVCHGQQSIAFQWPNVDGARSYHLLWGFSSRDYAFTNTVRRQPGETTTATATDLQAGVVYYVATQAIPFPRPVVSSMTSDYSPETVITTAPPVFVVQVFEACDIRGPWEPLTNFYFRANPTGRFYQSKLFIPDNP
jgi:hypothetical protein